MKCSVFPNVHIPNSWQTYGQGAWDHQCHRVVWKGSWVPQYQLLSFSCRRQLPTTNHLTQTCSSGVSISTKIFFQEKNHFLFDVHLYLLNEILSCLKSFSLRKEKKCGGWVFFLPLTCLLRWRIYELRKTFQNLNIESLNKDFFVISTITWLIFKTPEWTWQPFHCVCSSAQGGRQGQWHCRDSLTYWFPALLQLSGHA